MVAVADYPIVRVCLNRGRALLLGVYAPNYRWTCHKCRSVNEAGMSACGACGFPAVASADDIAGSSRVQLDGMQWFLVVLAYLGLLIVVGIVALLVALLLAETHGGLLPDALRPFAFILAWVAVAVLPVLGARAVWRRLGASK